IAAPVFPHSGAVVMKTRDAEVTLPTEILHRHGSGLLFPNQLHPPRVRHPFTSCAHMWSPVSSPAACGTSARSYIMSHDSGVDAVRRTLTGKLPFAFGATLRL